MMGTPRQHRLGRLTVHPDRILGIVVAVVLAVLVLLPLAVVLLHILWPGMLAGDRGLGDLSVLGDIVTRPLWRVSLTNSLTLATGTMLLGGLLGSGLAYLRHTYRFHGAAMLDTAAWVLLITPSFIVSQGWILFANRGGLLAEVTGTTWVSDLVFSPTGLILVMSLKNFPLAYLAVSAAMLWNVDDLTSAARLSGASGLRAWATIRVPLLFPAIASGAVLVFVDTIGDFGLPASLATVYRFPTLPYTIFVAINQSPIRFDLAGVLSAYLTLILAAAVALQFRLLRGSFFDFLSGRARPPARRRPQGHLALTGLVASVLGLAFLIPVGTSVVVSFMATLSGGLAVDNLTLAHYADALAATGPLREALRNSMVIAAIAAGLSLLVGGLATYVLTFGHSRLSRLIDATSTISLAVPGVILGVGMIFVWNQPWLDRMGLSLYGHPLILVLAAVAGAVPYVVRVMVGSVAQVSASQLEAAALQGASLPRRLRTILVPLTAAAVTSAGLAAFGSAVFDLAVTTILQPPNFALLPVAILRQFEQGLFGVSTAMTVIATSLTVAVIVTVSATVRRRAQRAHHQPADDRRPQRPVGHANGVSS